MQVQVRMRIRIQAHSMNEGTTTTAELSKSQLVTRAEQEQGPRDRDGPKRMAGRGAAYCAGCIERVRVGVGQTRGAGEVLREERYRAWCRRAECCERAEGRGAETDEIFRAGYSAI